MPLVTFDSRKDWEALYRVPMDDGTTAGFERRARERILGRDHWALMTALDVRAGQTVLIVGGGFGWVAEDWNNAGVRCTVVDPSPWIQRNKHHHARVPILCEDLLSSASRLRVCDFAEVDEFDHIISEDVMPCLADEECLTLAKYMRRFAVDGRASHWVTPDARPPLNGKTLEQWKTLLTPDKVVQRGTAVVL